MSQDHSDCNSCSSHAKNELSDTRTQIRNLLIALGVVVPIEIVSLLGYPIWTSVSISLFIFVCIFFGRGIGRAIINSIRQKEFTDINILMAIAIVGAVYLGKFEEGSLIILLFALGNALEDFGMERSKNALAQLVAKTPKEVELVSGNKKDVDSVKIGEHIVVRHGGIVPLDGIIVKGDSAVDESAITGEPVAKDKTKGDVVYAGSIVTSGFLEIRVTKEASQSTLSQIIKLTQQAQQDKGSTQRFIEKFATYYTPTVIVVATLIVLIPTLVLGQSFQHWFEQALTLLIISCPCALVIATPVSVFSALGNASTKGVLVKGGKYLEEMAKIDSICLDKTRTITEGQLRVTDIIPLDDESKDELIACAAGVEQYSEHPVAQAIVAYAKDKKIKLHQAKSFKAIIGKGIIAECITCDTKECRIGKHAYISTVKAVEQINMEQITLLEQEGKTVLLLQEGKKLKGIIAVSDTIRSDSATAIQQLKELGVEPILLTGDNVHAATFMANKVGITNIHADMLPQDKEKVVAQLLSEKKRVAMLGDGVNDAPALARATVGISFGAIGSDIAVENANIALMREEITLVPWVVKLGRKAQAIIKQNIALALSGKVLFLALAAMGSSSLVGAIFADVGVTIIVVFNGLRLYSVK